MIKRSSSTLALFSLLLVIVHLAGCSDVDSIEIVRVSLQNTEMYQYPTVSGDEEGATIFTQARHYAISEVRRNAETNSVAVYFYQAAVGFVGSDHASIRVYTGSDGASPPTNIKEIRFYFDVRN